MIKKRPSDFELQVLGVLWGSPGLTVREVRERLPDGKDRAYTSVLSVMQVMRKKGFLDKEKGDGGGGDRWRAVVGREEISKPILRRLTDQVFGGKPSLVMQQLLDAENLDPAEVGEIRKLLASLEENEPKKKREGK